jgi:outer membrane protein OmpA-like peptidoglycan-associated protein
MKSSIYIKNLFLLNLAMFFTTYAHSQNATVKGYVFEEQNRGFLNMARVRISDTVTKTVFVDTYTNIEGYFTGTVPAGIALKTEIVKEMFDPQSQVFLLSPNTTENLSIKMIRQPGYVFELTLAEKRLSYEIPTKAIDQARLEVYNNTEKKSLVDIVNPSHEFKVNFVKGNHYTILIRKPGYLAKRLEAYVNVKGCILCFEGVGEIRPGVVDNLSSNNSIGVLLANVEMEKAELGMTMMLSNIQYELGSADLKKESYKELDNLASIALNNPAIKFEIGSHTDSRGNAQLNETLSNSRSSAVVRYLVEKKNIPKGQLVSYGYGEVKLLNNCKDGVICSEVDHQKNRRTELKILSIDDQYIPQSLKQIKALEEFEADLRADKIETYKAPTLDTIKHTHNVSVAKTIQNKAETSNKINVENPQISNSELMQSSQQTDASKKYKIVAGKFKLKDNAQKVSDKLYLLGYANVTIIVNDGQNEVIVRHNISNADALETSKHLTLNDIENIVVEEK